MMSIVLVLLTGTMYIASSAGLIAFNKKIMEADRFPFSAGLGLLHAVFCSLSAWTVFAVKPDLFPSMSNPEKKVPLDRSLFQNAIVPIAICFSAQIILSNQAYLFADIAFLQMIKESNVIWVYLLSVVCAVEAFGWRQLRLVCLIMMATWVSITGEPHFSLPGFALQASSCAAETIKITLQGVLLTSSGRGLDALSYMLIVMPACAILFSCVFAVCTVSEPYYHIIDIPTMNDWMTNRWALLANACLALTLNFSGMLFIRCSSAVSYVLAGIMKDVMIVASGILFMGHETSSKQVTGFTLQVVLILLWSLVKTFPKAFANGLFDGLRVVFLGKELDPPPLQQAVNEASKDEAVKG